MIQFEKTPGGLFRCFDGDQTLYETEDIGIIYDTTTHRISAIVHKIGRSKDIENLFKVSYLPINGTHPEIFNYQFIASDK